jgi:hypothetical protein
MVPGTRNVRTGWIFLLQQTVSVGKQSPRDSWPLMTGTGGFCRSGEKNEAMQDILDSANASLYARVKPGMTETRGSPLFLITTHFYEGGISGCGTAPIPPLRNEAEWGRSV